MSSSKIKVLQYAPSLGLGGTEKTMQLFASYLDKDKFKVVAASPTDGPRGDMLRAAGVTVVTGQSLVETATRFKPDILHIHRAGWPEPELLSPLRQILRPNPTMSAHYLPKIVETNVFGRLDNSASGRIIDATLLVSHFCAERLRVCDHVATTSPRYQVLYNPVDTDFFAVASPPPSERDYTRPVFGRISRADAGKWDMICMQALLHVREACPDFTFLIIGGIPEAESFVREHALENNVRFLPPIATDAELAQFFSQLSFSVHSNKTGESFGLVIAEAMACGLPVITHPSKNWRDNAQVELVEHGVSGLVAETPEAYGAAILQLLRSPATCRAMGKAAQERTQRLFRVQDIVERLEEIYFELLGRG